MLHVIAKLSTSLGIIIFGLGSGYFGTAAYYERHPQSVAESGELNSQTSTIGYANKGDLLSITAWENWKTWITRERLVKHALTSETPNSSIFTTLKSATSSESSSVKKACADIYKKSTSDSEESKLKEDAKKYCGLKYPSPDST